MNSTPRRGPGRPKKGDPGGKTAWIQVRMAPEIRERLEADADDPGKVGTGKLAHAIEWHLRRSFELERHQEELTRMVERETQRAVSVFGSQQTYAVFRVLSDGVRWAELCTGRSWLADPTTADLAKAVINHLLSGFRPEGQVDRSALRDPEKLESFMHLPDAEILQELGGWIARTVITGLVLVAPHQDPASAPSDGAREWIAATRTAAIRLGAASLSAPLSKRLLRWAKAGAQASGKRVRKGRRT